MSDVLEFFRQKEPRFNDVDDAVLSKFIWETFPDFRQHVPFRAYYMRKNPPESLQPVRPSIYSEPSPKGPTAQEEDFQLLKDTSERMNVSMFGKPETRKMALQSMAVARGSTPLYEKSPFEPLKQLPSQRGKT